MKTYYYRSVTVLHVLTLGLLASGAPAQTRSPRDVHWLDAKTVLVSDHTAGAAYFVDAAAGKVAREVKLNGQPAGIAGLFVAEMEAGTVAELDPTGTVKRRLNVGARPAGVARAGQRLLVTDAGLNQVAFVDLATGNVAGKVDVPGLPHAVVVTPDGKLAAAVSRLPVGDARSVEHAAVLTLLDVEKATAVATVKLLPGTGNVTGLAVSPDGKWLYLVHTLARFTLPTTQLERGWVNTNGLTIYDLTTRKLHATVLLDNLSQGAADPWGIAVAPDGATAWITLAGTHELVRVDLTKTQELVGKLAPEKRGELSYDLAALYRTNGIARLALPGHGPRGVAVSPDGATVAVALYFSGQLALVDAKSNAVRPVSLGAQAAESPARKGERLFHDAKLAFQNWLSCATCHPDTRADGFNWDLLNDGMGNPKNSRSMLWSDRTPPMMSLGVREDMEHAVAAGFKFILFRGAQSNEIESVVAYLKSLAPAPSPHLVAGKLSAKAEKGKAVFDKAGCAACHPGPLFTDLKTYDVGTTHELDRDAKGFDTPTLVELWRSAPYLHDGSAPTLRDVLKEHNPKDQHGSTSKLSADDLDALIEYLLSL
jgi:DNA-binding beta-propeller fold protein YncE/cytochrome c5